jgi:palmitoyltransferase
LASTSSPGIITARNISKYNHFPYDDLLFCRDESYGTTRNNIPKLARSKFDRFKYHENVPRFDHYCGWVFNTIGEENYRWFLLFLLVHVFLCVYGSYCIYQLMIGEAYTLKLHEAVFFNRITGEELPSGNVWIIVQYMVNSHTAPAAVFFLIAVMSIALSLFLAYHVYLTSKGMTTNEAYKWSDVKKWYKAEKLRYQKALERKKIKGGSGIDKTASLTTSLQQNNGNEKNKVHSAAVAVTNGDVTCAGNGGGGTGPIHEAVLVQEKTDIDNDDNDDDDDDDDIQDPGPLPKNLYDRGLYENWKEVLFPISLRKTVVVRSQNETNMNKSKPKATKAS